MPVDPSLLRNPSNRKLFESQINDIEAGRRADADLVESVAGQEQRQQAQQQREAQTAANVQAETNFKNAGRPYYKDEAGRIVPEQNDADWQASQQKVQEQANQEIQWKREGRKYTKNAVDGSLVALESDEVLAARQQAEGEEIRKKGLTDQMKAIMAESGLSRKPLSSTEREKAEKSLKKAKQEGIYSITGKLGEASKQTDKAGWWDVVNNNPTEAATAAQKRLDRLSAPDADLDDDDLTDLDGNEATKPLAERIRSGRQMLADDDAARQSAESTRQKLADLKLRRDAPERWAQIQRERVAGMDMPTLQKHAAASSDSLKTRMADFESRAQTAQQEVGQWDTALKALQAENEQARAKGIPASEMVTMSDGSTWHKPLALKLGEVQAKAQAWESDPMVQQRQKALAVEAKELQGEIALHNETVAAANAKRQAEQDQQFARLAEIPALAGHGAFLQSLVQEQATRRAALDQRFPEGPDTSPEAQAAYAALDADYQTRLAPVQQALEEGDRATAAAVGRAYDMVTQAEARGTNVDQAIAALQKETGVSPEKARSMLGDAAKTDWTRGPAEAARVLSDGRVIVRPNLWTNEAGYRKAVESANASPGAKEAALTQFPALREQSAEQQITALQTLTAFRDWQAKQKPGMSAVETVERFSKEHGWWRSQRDQLLTGLGQGVIGIMQAGVGAWEWLTGDASSADVYSRLDRDAQRLAGASQALPAGQWTALGASLGVGSLPSLAIGGPIGAGLMRAGMGGAAALGILPRAAGAAKGVLTTAQATNLASGLQMTGVAGVAGVQTFGQVFGEAVQSYQSQGYDLETAQQKAALPAFASGASTMILTALGGFQGTEALARLAKDQGVKKTLGQYAKAVFGGGLKEGALEELPDQLIQSAIAVASYDPNRPMEQILEEAMVALIGGGAMGGAFTALAEAPNVSLSAQAPTPAVNTANLPETIAAAETAIDGYSNTALDPDTLARTQATARTLLYVAQGDIDSLPDSDLALIGVGRNAKGELENVSTPDGAPPRVKIESGQPIITQTTLDKLEKEMPAVRAAIPLDEASRRQANSTPQPSNEQTTSPGNPPVTATPDNSGSTPAGQSQQPGNPVGPAGGTPGTQTGSQPQELTEEAAERAEQIAVHLADRGLTEPQARAAAQAIVAEQGIVGAEYSEQVTQQAFDDAMGRQGWVRGSGRKYQWIPPTDNAVPSEATQPISPGKPGAASTANATGSQATPEASGRPGQGPASPAKGGEGLTQGAAGATPASAAPAGGMDTDAFVEARRKAIAATPPDKRRGAVKLLGSLEKALTRYGSAFDGVRFAAKDGSGLNLAGGGLVVQREQGKVFLDVDLARWADQHAGLVDKAGVVATTEVEEEFIHRAAVNVIPDAEMQTFWRSLPAALQEAVYQGYHAVDIQHGALPAKAPAKFEDRQSVQLGHEFLRMLVQDSQFQGRVSEAIAVDPRLGEKIIAFLKKLADRLRKLIDSAPTDVRVSIREYEARVTKEVQRLRKSLPDALKAKEMQPGQGMATAADNRTAVVKAGSTAPLSRTNFAPTEGATGTAHNDANDAIEYRWAVVDVSSLNISNADDGRINPDYPQDLQPRDRTSAGSEAQVADIARNMNLDRLSQASGVGDGAPIVGPDGVVESGNGRVMGMRRAHTLGSKAAQAYAEKLAATAATYGLTADQVKAVQHPVLVRVRTTDVDRVAFVLSANVSTIAPKREIEQAKIDAKQIVPDLFASFVPSEDGDVFTAANADFLRGYVSAIIPPAERPSIIDARGNLTQTGLRRIRNALFVHAYGDSPESLNALARLTESIDSSGTNIASALVAAAPRFAEQSARIAAGALYPLSITGDLAQTVQTLQDLRGRGEKVRDFLDQDRIPGIGDDPTPMQKELLQFLDENAGRPRAIVDAFNRYASAVDGAGDPKQASLFGDEPRPTTLELWRLASRPAGLGKGTVGAENITPQNALRVYRRLKKMEAEQGTLSGTQSQALERAERALGQLFMFDDTERVSRAYTLEQENAAPTGLNAEQLMLFKAAVRSMASPAEIEELSTNLRHLSSSDGYVRRLDPADSQGLNVVRFYGPARRRIVKKVWDMLDNSYRAIGIPYPSQDHFMQDDAQTAFWDVVMHQGTPVAYSVLKVTPWGYKTISSGQDGSEAGKAAWKTYFARLNQPGYYAELSGAPSAIAQKKDFPRVPVQQVQNILGKSVTPVDEYTYERRIAGLPVAHKKSIFGLPWLTPQSRPALPSSSSRTNSTGPATPPSVSASRTTSTTSPDLSGTGTDSTISLAAGRRRSDDGTADLFSFNFNAGLGLETLLSPAQREQKQQQAEQLDLFGGLSNAPAQPASQRSVRPRPASRGGEPAAQSSGADDLFARPGVAGKPGRDGSRRSGLGGEPGTGGNDADRGGVADIPETGSGAEPVSSRGESDTRERGSVAEPPSREVVESVARPAPDSPDRNFSPPASLSSLAPSGDKAKVDANLAAISLLRTLEDDRRNATPDEKRTLAAYTGWGSFKEAFNDKYESDLKNYWDDKQPSQKIYMPPHLRSWEQRWRPLHKRLLEAMSPEEYRAASRSTLTSHYTAAPVIRAMWKMVERLGFKGGRASEPAAGAGHFIGLQPTGDLADRTQWQAVELDDLSARMLSKLYPEVAVNERIPSEMRIVDGLGFERARIPNNSLDLVISNVPFHESGPRKKGFPTLNLHNFFFAHALDKVKPGGLVAFITSASTMQNNQRQRDFLASKGDLVAAFRLPNNAFLENAGTVVVTDIIILRKPDGTAFRGQPWRNMVEAGRQTITLTQRKDQKVDEFRSEARTNGNVLREYDKGGVKAIDVDAPIMVNEYFAAHPEHVLGSHSLQGSMYRGNEYTVTAPDGLDVGAALDRLAATLPENVMGRQQAEEGAATAIADRLDRPFSFVERDDRIYEVQDDGTMLEAEWAGNPAMVKTYRSWLKVKNAISSLISMENSTVADSDIEAARRNLNLVYDTHVSTHGPISRRFSNRHTHLYSDPEFPLTAALENEKQSTDKKGKKTYRYDKATIMRQRVVRPITEPTKAADLAEAVQMSMAWRGSLQPDYMSSLLSGDLDALMRQVQKSDDIFQDPATGMLQLAESYLTGNVRNKLEVAEAAAEDDPAYRKNVDALRKAQPERRSIGSISPTLGARWIPSDVYEAFVKEVLQGTDAVEYIPAGNFFRLAGSHVYRNQEYGTQDLSAHEILSSLLSMSEPMVYDTDSDGARHFNPKATAAAKANAEKMKRAFVEFVRTSTVDLDGSPVWQVAENAYNTTQNSYVTPKMTGSYLQFPGLSEDVWRTAHRRAVIGRFLVTQQGMMAHGVGSGKTFNQIILSKELRRLGLAKKPMIVVQNSTLGQFAASYLQAYPSAKVLVPTERDLQTQNRRKLVSRIATGDYDAVILSHSQFDLVANRPESIQAFMGERIQALKDLIQEGKDGERSRVRDLEGILKRLEDRLSAMLDNLGARQDSTIYFEDLGVDALIVDEAHNYKSVPIVTRMGRVKGVPSGADSQRAIGMLLKARHVQAKMKGKNVFLATGTPVKNSMAEAYIMMELAAPEVLRDYQIHNFDDFATSYGQVVSSTEISWSGSPKVESRFAKFINGPELLTMIRSVFDVAMGNEKLGLKVPKIKGGAPSLDIVPATPTVDAFNAWVRSVADRWAKASGKEKEKFTAVPIMTLQAGIVAALDPRLLASGAPDHADSKVNTAIREMLRIYKEGSARRSTQLVFADLRRPFNMSYLEDFAGSPFPEYAGGPGGFDLYEDIKRKLVAGGVPEAEILLMDPSMSKAKRTAMFEKVSNGELRIVVGSTETLGVGVNVQQRLKALHHLMPPRDFTPAMHEQRNGRAIRQGNLHYDWDEEIEIRQWGTEGSMDSAVYGTLGRKQRFITQLLMGEIHSSTFDDPTDPIAVNLAEMAARTMGDKDFIRRIEIEKELRDLRLEADAWTSELAGRRSRLASAENALQHYPRSIERMRQRLDALNGLWTRTAPRPEGVKESTDISDSPVYEFGGLTVDTAAKEGAITKPLAVWLLDQSITMERRGLRQSLGLPLKINGLEFSVRVETTMPGSDTPGDVSFQGERIGSFSGAEGLLRQVRSVIPSLESRIRHEEGIITDSRVSAGQLRTLLDRDTAFPQAAELETLEQELLLVDERLAAKAAPKTEPKPGETAAPLATSTKSVYNPDDEPGRPGRGIRSVDRWTSGSTSITGSRVTREQGQRIGALWRSWAKSGLRQSAFDWTPGPELAQRLAAAFPGVPVLTPAQFNALSNLPVIGSGFESEVHADRAGGAVYKILNNTGSSGAGIWNEVGWTSLGRLDWTYKPATRPRHFGIRMALQNLMGGTPTELAGISPGGLLILKQPLSPDAEAGETGNLFQARREIGIIDVPPSMIYEPGYRAGVVFVEGRPYLVTDIKPDNFVADNQGDIRFNDAIFGRLTAQAVSKVPGLASVVRLAATEAQRLGDRSARLFKSTVAASPAGDASPIARLGWNHLDRAVSAKLAAHVRWMNEKTGAGETVAKWAGAENAKPFVALARVLKRELLPDSMLPREVAARKREMEIKTALGAQRAMDLVRALSNAPKFSDMAYPPEFSNNPAHRRDLYLAMAREKAMSSLPQPMQDLAKRLRDMLLEMGREAVKQGRMSLDTFAALQDGYMPHYYKEDVQREKSLFHRFRLGLRDILAQRTTAWHIVDHSSKDSSGQPRIVSWQGNQWRFRNEGHRDAFYEDFILQQALEQITNRNGKANRNLTLSDLRAPAKLPPETRGRLKEILRALRSQYTKEKPLTVEEQEKAGLIMDPVYAIARYTAQMVHDNSTAEFFNFVAGNPDWVSSNATPGFTEIPDNPRFGRLAGKYVTDDVARQLLEMVEAPNVALQIYDTLLSWWKMGKTVYNIGTHARNVLSNVLFSQLAGNSAWNLGNVRYYREAIHALRNGGRDLLEAYEMGVLGADFVTAELRQTLRQLLPDPATIEDDGKAPGILLGIGRSIGKFIPQALKNPLHRAHNQITALYQAEDEVFKLAAYLKAKSMGLSSEQARDHVRQWFPYFDGGTSMTLKALGRTTMPFLGFYRESIRIFGQAIKERPVALAAGMAIPSLLTLFSAMLLGLDEEDLDEVKQTALRGKASGLLGLTPLDQEPLFSILLPWRTEGGNLQQFDLSAIYPFTEMLGERIEGTEGQDWWQRQWRKLITAGPLGSLAYSFGANEDPFSRQPLVEPGMSGWEAFQKRFEHTYQALLPPLTPGIPGLTVGGSNIETLSKSGALPWKDAQRTADKTLQMRSAPEAFVRAVLGLDVRSANPSLYELADAWRKANGYEVNEGTDYGSTTPTSRARKALFKELAQETPNRTAIRNISATLKRMGAPVETEQDINRLLFYRDPLKIIGGNKKLGITPQDAQERFRASLKGESRRVLDAALRTFADIKQRAPALLRQANLP